MADPLGLIGSGGVSPSQFPRPAMKGAAQQQDAAGDFADVLRKSLDEVNKASQEATQAVEGFATGQASVEEVVLAANKHDNAFRMLQQLRNRVMEAYDEIKQMRT